MKQPIIGIAQNFSDDELLAILQSDEVKRGTHGFLGFQCPCGIRANVPVSFLWTCAWTCSCGKVNTIEATEEPSSPWNDAGLGPSKAVINMMLGRLGLHGRKY